MAVSRSTPFIASWDVEDPLDATAPLDEILAARSSPRPAHRAPPTPSASGPSRLAWSVIGVAGALAIGALVWAAEGGLPRVAAVDRRLRAPPPPVAAVLEAIPARIDLTPPQLELADADEPIAAAPLPQPAKPAPARAAPQPRDELAAALLERRRQLSQNGSAGADVEAVAAIHFDPSRRSARVVYRLENSAAELVEYWALRDGRWQPLDD